LLSLSLSLSPLQSCFIFFLPLPPTANSSINVTTNLTSTASCHNQPDLVVGAPVTGSTAPLLLQPGYYMQNENSFCMQHN
jgi:hypothetical protein